LNTFKSPIEASLANVDAMCLKLSDELEMHKQLDYVVSIVMRKLLRSLHRMKSTPSTWASVCEDALALTNTVNFYARRNVQESTQFSLLQSELVELADEEKLSNLYHHKIVNKLLEFQSNFTI
jgi:hypothetical protein